jgi:thiamine-phosphate pyrophosphorylase
MKIPTGGSSIHRDGESGHSENELSAGFSTSGQTNPVFPPLYAILSAEFLQTSELVFAEMLAKSGVELIQYRNKKISSRMLFERTESLLLHLRTFRVRLIVNDRADIAALARAGGVHVGQDDLPVNQARAICGPGCWVGVSTHTLEQVREASATSADYVAVGPIFATQTKQSPNPVVGIEFIRRARALTSKPLVAIGGITLLHAEEVFRSGADSIAVARDLIEAPDPRARAKEFLDLAAQVLSSRN